MEIGKKVCTFLRGTFAVGFLSAAALFSPAKADAALSVTNIDYDKSEMTIKSDAKDTTLYFSNSSAKKWDTCVGEFGEDGTYVMDISWISVTKNYPITFKGDVSTDVLKVTLPKQIPNFKVKYDKVNTRFNYTNDGGREIEYRKNNTSAWEDIPSSDNGTELQNLIQRLTENGATLYFRLKGENGTSDSAVGKRPSKEVSCKIAKKANAPSVSLNTSNNTIAVQAGWQVRKVSVTTKSDVQYVTGWERADSSYSDATEANGFWHTYTAKGNIPLTEIAKEMMLDTALDEGSNEKCIYLQFRKKATSSAQVSRMTTIKIPKQEETPEPGITLELTSLTTYKVTFTNASISQPFEYCVVPPEDITGTGDTAKISNLQDVTWKTSNSGVGIELKQKDAPEGSRIFYRRKAIGSLGSDDFKLATNYEVYKENQGLTYPTDSTENVKLVGDNNTDTKTVSKIDGQCVQSDTKHYITFSITTDYNQTIDKIYLSHLSGNKTSTSCVPVFTSTVKSAGKVGDKNKYIINATIKEISLPQEYKTIVEDKGEITLYAYITLKTPSGSSDAPCIISTTDSGLIITITEKSSIETDLDTTDRSNQINVKRWVGYPTKEDGITTGNNTTQSDYQFADFWFRINGSKDVKEIKFGNTTLKSGTDYTVERITETSSGSSKDQKVTIHLSQCEKNLSSYYGKQTSLVVILGNSTDGTEEKLSGVTVTLLSPVSLNSNYSWTFKKGKLITEKTTTTTANGVTTTTTEPVNDYSASYTKNNSNTINEVTISNISLIGGTVEDANAKKPVKDSDGKITGEESACEADTKNVNITLSGDNGKIVFSNEALNWLSSGSRPVTLKFKVEYSNNTEQTFVIDKDCTFYVL